MSIARWTLGNFPISQVHLAKWSNVMPISLILDCVLALLLIVTIGYAILLNKRLEALRRNKDELEELSLGFIETTRRAEVGIGELGSMTDVLKERIKRAESLRDDLVFLSERGNTAADRLEGAVREARDKESVAPLPAEFAQNTGTPQQAPAATDQPQRDPLRASLDDRVGGDEVSEAERELLKALRSAG